MRYGTALAVAATVLGAAGVVACSSPPPPETPKKPEPCEPQRPKVTLMASETANALAGGQGLPGQVRLYQLKSEAKLMNAFFDEVWRDDASVLSDDLLAKQELTVFPGQSQTVDVELTPDSRVLTAVALFRQPRGKDWFVSYDFELPRPGDACPVAEPLVNIWIDRMKIQDGEGRVPTEAAISETPAVGQSTPTGGN